MAQKKATDRRRLEPSLATIRSAITNGSQVLAGCDHRSARMRRLKDLISAHVSDLGGRDAISEAEFCLIRRASTLTLELEAMESRFDEHGGATVAELDGYQRAAGSLRRLLESLGLKRRARDVTPPDLEAYLQSKRHDAEDAEEVA